MGILLSEDKKPSALVEGGGLAWLFYQIRCNICAEK